MMKSGCKNEVMKSPPMCVARRGSNAFVIQMHFMSCLKGGTLRCWWVSISNGGHFTHHQSWLAGSPSACSLSSPLGACPFYCRARCTVSAHSIEHIDMHRFHLGRCCLVSPRRLLYCWLLLLLAEFSSEIMTCRSKCRLSFANIFFS